MFDQAAYNVTLRALNSQILNCKFLCCYPFLGTQEPSNFPRSGPEVVSTERVNGGACGVTSHSKTGQNEMKVFPNPMTPLQRILYAGERIIQKKAGSIAAKT